MIAQKISSNIVINCLVGTELKHANEFLQTFEKLTENYTSVKHIVIRNEIVWKLAPFPIVLRVQVKM